MSAAETAVAPVDYRTDPSQYKHWKLSFNGPVATLGIDIAEDGGIRDGYKLKLNSSTSASISNCTTQSSASVSSIPKSKRWC